MGREMQEPICDECKAVLITPEEIEAELCEDCIAIQEKFNNYEGKGYNG